MGRCWTGLNPVWRRGVSGQGGPATVGLVLRAVYVDLDGTLLGPSGSLLAGADGGFSLEGVRALQACARAEVEVVLCSGRRQRGVAEGARLLGQRSYIFELGCGLVLDGELEWLTDGIVPSAANGTIYEQIAASGAPQALLDAFPGRLEYHLPWSAEREVSHLFRGWADDAEVTAILTEGGWDWLRLVDNGVITDAAGRNVGVGRRVEAESAEVELGESTDLLHAFHLMPARASKARAVARHMQNRGYLPEECIACGDSREDMDIAAAVGCFWMMRNGVERDSALAAAAAARSNVRVSDERFGAGVYEAVVRTLAGG